MEVILLWKKTKTFFGLFSNQKKNPSFQNHFSRTRFLEPDFSNQISRTTFLEKWLQIKWLKELFSGREAKVQLMEYPSSLTSNQTNK